MSEEACKKSYGKLVRYHRRRSVQTIQPVMILEMYVFLAQVVIDN